MAIKKYSILVAVGISTLLVVLYMAQKPSPIVESQKTIGVGSAKVLVDLANTHVLREKGLSGRETLAAGRGMLFVFETDDRWGIWMKDMRFAIDIVWINSAGTVVTIAPNVKPDTFPNSFRPIAPARYVLELPAGSASDYGLVEGIKIVL